MKYYIIAGEASGDIHAANLIKAIKAKTPDAQFRGWGGDLMQNQGCTIVKHYKDLAFMGFWEVFIHLRTILKNLSLCKKDILEYQPDIIILIDYPGFNLRIAEFAHKSALPVAYYISPQVWAWKRGRVKKIKAYVDDMMVILPFEEDFYAKYDYPVHYVGHPLLDEISHFDSESDTVKNFRQRHGLDERPIVVMLPGSRKQEIKSMLPIMVKVAKHFPKYQFVISTVKWQTKSLYKNIAQNIPLIEGDTYAMLMNAKAAIVTSGTVSLETALMGVPQVVGYRASWISYFIALLLVKGINYISLANLILDKQVFNELIQPAVNEKRLVFELDRLLHDKEVIDNMKRDYKELQTILGSGGASEKAAAIVMKTVHKERAFNI